MFKVLIDKKVNLFTTLEVCSGVFKEVHNTSYANLNSDIFDESDFKQYAFLCNIDHMKACFYEKPIGSYFDKASGLYDKKWQGIADRLKREADVIDLDFLHECLELVKLNYRMTKFHQIAHLFLADQNSLLPHNERL